MDRPDLEARRNRTGEVEIKEEVKINEEGPTKMSIKRTIALSLTLPVSIWLTAPIWAQVPTYKMTTDIPKSITTPDKVETPIGTLKFFDGIPTGDTTRAVYDYVDRARAVQVYIAMMPAVSTYHLREGQREMGAHDSNQILIWEQLGDSKSLVLTYNNTSLYTWGFLDLKKDGPTVIEIPPDVLGILDDMDMRYLSDMGAAGPDKGKGGKYLVLPPGYEGEVPEGYFVVKSPTYCVWNFMRGYVRDVQTRDVKEAADNIKSEPEGLPAGEEGQPAEDGVQEHVGDVLQHHSAERLQLLREPQPDHPGRADRLHRPRDPGPDRRSRHRQRQAVQTRWPDAPHPQRGGRYRQRLRPGQHRVPA